MDLMEITIQITQCLTPISIFSGLILAIYGYNSWRKEYIGKRNIELAEETLSLFYEASDIIDHMRSPFSFNPEEIEVSDRGKNETEEQFAARKRANVIFYRYNQHQEIFNKIHASRYRFMAQIGKDKAAPFDDLREIVNEIIIAARILTRLWALNPDSLPEDGLERHLKHKQKQEDIFWAGIEEDDLIKQKLKKVIVDIEETCKPVIWGKNKLN